MYKNKKYMFSLVGVVFLLVIFNLMFNDFLNITDSIYLLCFKWLVNFGLVFILLFICFKLFKIKDKSDVLIKDNLVSRTDLIIKKYKGKK